MTATLTTPKRIRIVGQEAAAIATAVARFPSSTQWQEVQLFGDCGYGCKLYARKIGAVTQYELMHSCSYGCPLGHDWATSSVPVSVCPKATA